MQLVFNANAQGGKAASEKLAGKWRKPLSPFVPPAVAVKPWRGERGEREKDGIEIFSQLARIFEWQRLGGPFI
jgi:hypothetical protein